MNYYNYDKDNIALSLTKAMSEYASPEVVQYLLDERNKKIGSNADYFKYKDDSLTKSAEEYIKRYGGSLGEDIEELYKAQSDIAASNLEKAAIQNREAYYSGIDANNAIFDNARRDMYSAYRRNALNNEEILAAKGLGRGISNNASSGFGESSRMAQNLTYQNNLYDSYKAQSAAAGQIAHQYAENNKAAQDEYNEKMFDISSNRIEQENSDRELRLKLDEGRVSEAQNRTELEIKYQKTLSDIEQRAFENSLAQRELANDEQKQLFEQAYELFKAAGKVINEQMAAVLGIPVGTMYWQYVVDLKNANTSAANANVKYLNYEIDKQNADTKRFEAETDRAELTGDY